MRQNNPFSHSDPSDENDHQSPSFENMPRMDVILNTSSSISEEVLTELSMESQTAASADYFLKLGNKHYNSFLSQSVKPDLERAIQLYQKAVEMDPQLSEGYVKLASALWDKGDIPIDTAIQYCQKAIHLNQNNSDANLFLGYFLRKAGRMNEAIQEFKTASKKARLKASKPQIALGVGLIHQAVETESLGALQRLKLTSQGLAHFTWGCLLLATDPKNLNLFRIAIWKDIQVYSILWMGKLLQWMGLPALSKILYQWGTKIVPNEGIFYQLLGDLCHEKNQPVESVYHYRLALEQEPQNGMLLKKTGIRLFLNKDYPNALHYLEKALAQSPDDFDILYHLGRVHSERKELIRGLYFFKESALLMPENPYVHSHMGYLMFKLEDFEGAIQEYRLAVSYGEDDVWTSTVAQTLGVLYYQVRQDMDAAVAMFQLSFQLNPSNLDSMVMLADLYFEQGNLQSAVGAYQYILKHEPENAEYYSYLGYLLWQMDKNDEAILAYEKAIHFDPESYLSFNNLGVIYLDELRENQKALGLFQKALALKSDYTLACFNMGRALENMGNAVMAANAYSTTLEMNAENPELEDQEILAKLDGLFKTQ